MRMTAQLASLHSAYWSFDRWYRLAWYVWPGALAVLVTGWICIDKPTGTAGPAASPWAKPDASAPPMPVRRSPTLALWPEKLQNDAMQHAGVKQPSPDVNVGARKPGSLPVQHETVFELKAGEVSQPYNDPSASYLYKVVSIREIPLAEVKDAIAHQLSQQMTKDKMESIASSVTPELNETYFGPPPQMSPPGAALPPGGPAASQAVPPAQAPQQSEAPPK